MESRYAARSSHVLNVTTAPTPARIVTKTAGITPSNKRIDPSSYEEISTNYDSQGIYTLRSGPIEANPRYTQKSEIVNGI